MNWKNIRFFVSSTFKDMDVERDALHSIIEPKLNEYLSQYCCSVEFVDLRHSVKTDANKELVEREKKICTVCLNEIDRCSPYFIGFLGHRYGWIPPQGIMDKDDSVSYPSSVDFDQLSVTAHEFVYGFSKKDIKGLVFLRSEKSYQHMSSKVLADYLDEGENKVLLDKFRDFVTDNESMVKVIPYELNLADVNVETISEWVDEVYNAIIALIKDELSDNTVESELNDFLRSQESFVQNKIRNFRGRTVELEECRVKIEKRDGCILSMRERGIGVKSFHCKLYSEYRMNPQNICLFYSPHANVKYNSIEQAIYFWTSYLIREYTNGEEELPLDWKEQFSTVCSILDRIIERLEKEGRMVYFFIGDASSIYRFLSKRNIVVNIVFFDENSDVLRPLMYMLKPFRKETVREIVKPLRNAVAQRLMEHKRSTHAEWLHLAVEQLQNLNRLDFIAIRNGDSLNQEQSIIDHQLKLIDSFPSGEEMMTTQWIEKIRKALGGNLIDSLIYYIGLNPNGFCEKEICRILEIDSVLFTMIRQMLGSNVLYEIAPSKWALVDGKVWNEVKDSIDYEACKKFNNHLKDYLWKNSTSELYKEMAFKMAMLTHDTEFCIRFLDKADALELHELQSFKWCASNQPELFKSFIEQLINSINGSYRLIYNLILCLKRLYASLTKEMYLYGFTLLKNRMRNLWNQKRIDSQTFSLLGDVLACEADFYHKFGSYKAYKDCLRYNLLFSLEQMKDESLWTKFYLLYVINVYQGLYPESRYDFLVNNFLKYENSGLIQLPQYEDATTYAIVLCYTAEELIVKGEGGNGVMLLKKGLSVFNRLLMLQYKNSVETVLKPHDTMRNILLFLSRAYDVYENTMDEINFEWLGAITDVLMEHCSDCKKLYDDQSYWYYYEIAVRKIMNSDLNSEDKIKMLYDILFEALVDKPFACAIMERQTSDVRGMTIVFFMIYAAILKELSLMDNHRYELPESHYKRMFKDLDSFVKKEKYETFEDLLTTILPIMGAKLGKDNCLVPTKLKTPMIIIYEAMLNVELAKDNPDVGKVTCVANSLFEEVNSLYGKSSVTYQLKIRNFEKFCSIFKENRSNYGFFEDFTDALGMEGNEFVESWKDDEDVELNYHFEMNYSEEECMLNQEELEEYIESDLYHEIIDSLSDKVSLTFYEAYYLALAYLRTGSFETAFLIYNRLLYICYDEKNRSAGEFFSVLTNAMISALMARRIEEFEYGLQLLRGDDYEDEDIQMILEVYNKMKQNAEYQPDFPQPYGFVI